MDTDQWVVAIGFLAFLSFLGYLAYQSSVKTQTATYVQIPPSLRG